MLLPSSWAQEDINTDAITSIFELQSISAVGIESAIRAILTKDSGKLQIEELDNKIIVTDTLEKVEEVKQLIEQLDVKQKTLTLEAKIIQIILNDDHIRGVDWEAIVLDHQTLNLRRDASDQTFKKRQLSLGTISAEDYPTLLEALDTVGIVNVISESTVMIEENREATVPIGLSERQAAPNLRSNLLKSTELLKGYEILDTTAQVYVTPTFEFGDKISLKIKPRLRFEKAAQRKKKPNPYAITKSTDVDTTIDTNNGDTVVIGGLLREERMRTTTKIPFLGDLPFLGFAFSNQTRHSRKTELVIFLTPKMEEKEEGQ